ncbi:MAG: ABC-F family ATP-binding cassette domain-containing protein [Nitrospiraceae bacterium]|nr:ATP-binding cassette domain-containing protein [Nitrospirota bacterium]MDA8340599.1 ABC-F family ATP-binding cassette domain-containing protein [Nitrospiraceae bacterium]
MIQVGNLSKAYGQQVIFDDIGFTVNAGERIGLVGRNGHGKTTLFKMILGEERSDDGIISIPNNYKVGHLSQHISFTEESVLKEGCLGLRPAEDGRDETYKVEAILMGLGFSADDFMRNPLELSGGYQIRLNLAKLLISEPNLLLLDEPTNYLDILSIRWLIQFLRNWKNELILITHDRDFMDSVTTHTMGIHRCTIRKIEGPTQKLYEQILMEEEVYEKTRINEEKKRKETEQFINRFRAQATRASAVQSKIKALQKKEKLEKISEIKNLDFEFRSEPFLGKWLVEATDLSFSFAPEVPPLIDKLSMTIGKDDRIAIIGKNGKGKTTLLNLLAGELMPLSGSVTHNPKLKLAYFGQTNIQRLDSQKTVEEEILDTLPEYNRRAARNICGIMMFEGDKALKKISVLSGGEKSRVLLGKLLVSPANLLLLDEPTNHLDMESIDSLLEAIDAFEGAVMIVTHSEMILHAIATRLIVFDDGKVSVFEGTYQDFLGRVGWKNENNGAVGRQAISEQSKNTNKKDMRRMRAELINSRSRILGALQKRIAEVEETIMQLEGQIEKDTQALLDASVKGSGESINTLSKSIHESKARIDTLFDELAALTEDLNTKSGEFEERLKDLN